MHEEKPENCTVGGNQNSDHFLILYNYANLLKMSFICFDKTMIKMETDFQKAPNEIQYFRKRQVLFAKFSLSIIVLSDNRTKYHKFGFPVNFQIKIRTVIKSTSQLRCLKTTIK